MTTATQTTKTLKARKNGRVHMIQHTRCCVEFLDTRYRTTGDMIFVSGTKYRVRIDMGGSPWRLFEITGVSSFESAWEVAMVQAANGKGDRYNDKTGEWIPESE